MNSVYQKYHEKVSDIYKTRYTQNGNISNLTTLTYNIISMVGALLFILTILFLYLTLDFHSDFISPEWTIEIWGIIINVSNNNKLFDG